MESLSIIPRALGALFYYPPEHQVNQSVLSNLFDLKEIYQWSDPESVVGIFQSLDELKNLVTRYEFSVLFEGQGEMVAPPWGSVYLNKDNLVMGDTTAQYQYFLSKHDIDIETGNEPVDQFGLMMWALAALIESGSTKAYVELLQVHLLPWAMRYLELLQGQQQSIFYAELAKLATLFLEDLKTELGIEVGFIRLFK